MNKANVTWVLGIVGWVVSFAMFFRWLGAHDWDFFGGWVDAFTASDFATGLLLDLVTVTVMMVAVAVWDRRRLGPRGTAAVIACLSLSVSMSLAVYLARLWQLQRGTPAGS